MNNELIERVARTIYEQASNGVVKWANVRNEERQDYFDYARAVLAELAGELRDAERYRWMRTAKEWDSPIVVLGYSDYEVAQGKELDKAIDEARRAVE